MDAKVVKKPRPAKLPYGYSLPQLSPLYMQPPFDYRDAWSMTIPFRSDPRAIAQWIPKPLVPDPQGMMFVTVSRFFTSGFGHYNEMLLGAIAKYRGRTVNHCAQMYVDDEPPISAGREIWGFPKKYAKPVIRTVSDTLTGTLHYANELVAMGTMGYKHEVAPGGAAATAKGMTKTQCNLKIIPDVDGKPKICQLVAYNLTDIEIKGSWVAPARLQLFAHVNAPVADLPVRRVIGGRHFVGDLTLPHGRVLFDYLR